MKKLKLIIIIFTVVFLAGCSESLLDTTPYSAIGSTSMWTTESLADLGVNGVYQTLRQDYVGLNRWYFDQESFTGMSRGATSLTNGNIVTTDGLFVNYWKQNYEGIHRANAAILNLPNSTMAAEKKARLIAECKFLRAWFNFNLNQVFKGVPLYQVPVTLEEANKGRETEAKIWETIVTDLTDCIIEVNLPNIYVKGNANYGRATKAAAYALTQVAFCQV